MHVSLHSLLEQEEVDGNVGGYSVTGDQKNMQLHYSSLTPRLSAPHNYSFELLADDDYKLLYGTLESLHLG